MLHGLPQAFDDRLALIGDALALQMIVVVAIVITVQNLVQRRNSKWLS